ncbi:hypothetical protein HA51_09020 [Pantoea rwandensis]|uniref:Uncharacterized protein n=1 Tax=Pantoea rwandensis TaxID=1076550 RepID=A0A1X1D038_9GAMM|nr:hypothetical protein HA51_09020 [Pantoea rwandensis]
MSEATAPLLLQRAIRSAEAETLCQEPVAWMRQAVRVGLDGLTRTVVRHDVAAEGTAQRREDGPAAAEVLWPALNRVKEKAATP